MSKEMSVSVDSALQIDTVCQCWIRLHWSHYKSITTPEDLKELERLVSVFYSKPPMLHCWNKSPYGRNIFDGGFVQFIDNAITKCENTQMNRRI